MMSIIAVFFVGLLIPMGVIDADSSALSLARLCKGEKVHLRTISQLESLIEEMKSYSGECPDTVKDALRDMKKLTDASGVKVCTMDQAKAITAFVDKYLKDAPDGTKRGLPEPLEKFAIAYGMKVSGICSHRMVRELPTSSSYGYVRDFDRDMPEFFKLVSEDSSLGNVLDPIIKTGEVILPVDLIQAIPGLVEHVHLLVPQQMGLLKFKRICQEAFQPVYEPLLLPLAHLIRAGFNNREYYWAWRYHYKGRLWSRAVFLCEMAKMINPDLTAEIKDQDEAAIVKALDGLKMGEKVTAKKWNIRFNINKKPMKPGDTIYGRFDFSIKSLVKAFDANKNHVQLLRERIVERSFRVARRLFKKKGFSTELIKTLKAARVESGSEADFEVAKDKFITLMNSPQDDSTAYKLFVSSSKYLYDKIAGLIAFAIYIGPAILTAVFLPEIISMALGMAAGNFYDNYIAVRDKGPWNL